MEFKHLSDVHTGRYTQRVEHDVDWCAVRHIRHVLFRKDPGDYTLVPVASTHLVPYADLTLLDDVDTYELVDTRRQFISIFTVEHFDVEDDAAGAVRYTQ